METACVELDPAFQRINYEVLGNSHHQLHGHVHPGYRWEPDDHRGRPVWLYPDRTGPAHQLSPRHNRLRAALTAHLHRIAREAYC